MTKTFQTAPGTKRLTVEKPGIGYTNGHNTKTEYIHLFDNIFCNKERTHLFDRRINEETGEYKYTLIKTSWGIPVLDAVFQEEARGDEKLDYHTFYTIHLSGRSQEPKIFNHYQIKHGQWAAAFTGIPIARRMQEDMYANAIFAQQDAFGIYPQKMPEHTGFQLIDGEWVYVLRTSEYLLQDGSITGNHPALARYSFDSESHTKHLMAWKQHGQEIPKASLHTIHNLFKWDIEVEPSGNRLLTHLFSYRSLISSLLPIETAIIAAAKDGTAITDGGSGSGKTSAIDHARGIDGPTPYRAERDTGFKGSITGIETRISPLRDTLVSVSDFHFNTETPSEHEQRMLADKFDSFISSLADSGEVRERGTKNITAAQGTRIKAGIIFDGETMPNLFLSRLRRAIVLQFERGTLDVDRVRDEWWQSQGWHTANGHAIISWILSQLNNDMDTFLSDIQQAEESYIQLLISKVKEQKPSFDTIIARSLANNYSRLLTPIWMIEQSIGIISSSTKDIILDTVLKSLYMFIDMIDNGGPSAISKGDMITMIKLALEHGDGYALAMDNSPLKGSDSELLNRLGYERTLLVDNPWKPSQHGYHLANISEDKEVLWVRPDALLELAKRWAKREGIKFPYNHQTLPSFLVRLDIAIKSNNKSTWPQRFDGNLDRRLKVPHKLLYSEGDIPPEPPNEPDNTINSAVAVTSLKNENKGVTKGVTAPTRSTSALATLVTPATPVTPHKEHVIALTNANLTVELMDRSELSAIIGDDTQPMELQRAASNRLMELDETRGKQRKIVEEPEHEQPSEPAVKLTRRHPRKYADRPIFWYNPFTGSVILPDGKHNGLPPNTPLTSVLNMVEGYSRRKKSAILFLTSGQLKENRPGDEWFDVSDGWERIKFFKGTLYAEYTKMRFEVKLYGSGGYFGENMDIDAIREAWLQLDGRLSKSFNAEGYKLLGSTPAQSGRELLLVSLPKGQSYQVLPDELLDLIIHNFGQARIETFPPNKNIIPDGVHVLDGTWMYAGCISHLPVGPVHQDNVDEFIGVTRKDGTLAPKCPGLYNITVTVPDDWNHIGLIKAYETDGDGNAIYPNTPGTTFTNWTTADELAVAVGNGWEVHINERIYWPDTDNITDPLAHLRHKLVGLREEVANELNQGYSIVLDLQKSAIRAILLHLIGSFYRTGTIERHFTPYEELPLEVEPYGDVESTATGIYWHEWVPFTSTVRQSMVHPEWSVTAWGRAKARIARLALRLPYEDIVSIRTDSIWSASRPDWLDSEYTGKPGSFKEKERIEGPFTWPIDGTAMRKFVVNHHIQQRNSEDLQQELNEETRNND
jgi:hypothetical protein